MSKDLITPERMMIIKELKVERQRWGANEGKFLGNIEFQSKHANIAFELSPEQCDRIMAACADALVRTAKDLADQLTTQTIEARASVSAIDDKP